MAMFGVCRINDWQHMLDFFESQDPLNFCESNIEHCSVGTRLHTGEHGGVGRECN
jgi:hypothetical protein